MSTLKTNTLSNAAGSKSVPVDTVVSGTAKAWVNFNGTGTVAIRAAFNVSSITDVGVGQYYINLTASLSDVNFSTVATGGTSISVFGFAGAGPVGVGQAFVGHYSGGAFADPTYLNVSIFR